MATQTFYWHDYETFGTDPARDRPVQFAGQRTTADLEPVGEPQVFWCAPPADYLPDPGACLVTGILPSDAGQRGSCEAEFIAAVHAELARPGTCGVGYNSLRFDDEFTRYTLWRNFHDPYAREWQNGNSRWDLIDVVRMAYALRPDGIEWPRRDDGTPSFRLEHLTDANDLEHGNAHEALSDVRATIALARRLRRAQPRLFDYALTLRSKREVAKLIDVTARKPLLHVSARYPASRGCTALVVPLAFHPRNANAVIVFDLTADPADLLELDADEVRRRVFTAAAELADGEERIPLKLVYLNKSPMLATPALLDDAAADRLGIDRQQCRLHYQRIRAADAGLLERVRAVFDEPPVVRDDVDARLYDGFVPDADRALCEQVRTAAPATLDARHFRFRDERLNEMLGRYRARNWPDSLDSDDAATWRQWCRQRLTDPQAGAPMTFDRYFARLDELRPAAAGDDAQVALLDQLRRWGKERAAVLGIAGDE